MPEIIVTQVVGEDIMSIENDENYSSYYKKQDIVKVYPNEFAIRSFLGSYPNHKINKADLIGKNILDLGFGDGRNIPLLADLGLKIHGIEVTQEICDYITERMADNGIVMEARVGRNSTIPYPDAYFDNILACSACYYIDPGQNYSDNLTEIARVMKSGGLFIHSVPMSSTFILENAKDLGNGHMEVTRDPYGVRVGQVLKKFDSVEEIEKELAPWFTDITVGSCRDDYWGSKVHLWLIVCRRK
ncbi:class I SAM-dependent methyltransferase [Runella aurantiaca]|uniref:Class I SAM-dependent methyltransferase n=1 Tax=Runella aurantiaca TaxID=2282308 RepID=A0A369IGB7_9BACT|nr:class I SAM-dependent methyltransferase [Runella aurantiaca]RDB07820.1 class I SAM-dependent methyltransferase [Runella aurantiaca]